MQKYIYCTNNILPIFYEKGNVLSCVSLTVMILIKHLLMTVSKKNVHEYHPQYSTCMRLFRFMQWESACLTHMEINMYLCMWCEPLGMVINFKCFHDIIKLCDLCSNGT